jgi:tRNA threonylcarbamoyladenosine biosynthesis protein TsaB
MTPTREVFLCLDTSTATARVAVLDAGGVVHFTKEATAERHSIHVLSLCAEALCAVDLVPAELAGIACGGGPGSFTGLRVGMAVAKGLALPTGVPLYVVSSLEAMAVDILASRSGSNATAVPCLDAGKGEVYAAAYAADAERLVRALAPPCRLTPAALQAWLEAVPPASPTSTSDSTSDSTSAFILAGNGAQRYRDALGAAERAEVAGPSAVSVGRLALLQRARHEVADLATSVPIYGRPPDITVKRGPA